MTVPQRHVIRRTSVDLTVVGSDAEGFALQARLGGLCRDWLAPALDAEMSRLAPADEYWRIDRLDIDLGVLAPEALDARFVAAVAAAVAATLAERLAASRPPPSPAAPDSRSMEPPAIRDFPREKPEKDDPEAPSSLARLSAAQTLLDAFAFFLQSGALPWRFRLAEGESLEQSLTAWWTALTALPEFAATLRARLAAPASALRLARQLSPTFLRRLATALSPRLAEAAAVCLDELAAAELAPATRTALAERLWQAAFTFWAAGPPPTHATLTAHWRRLVASTASSDEQGALAALAAKAPAGPDEPAPPTPPAAATAERPATPTRPALDFDEGIFVDCAGVVLLHPFLPTLFERLQVAEGAFLRQPDRALALLHFLATGATPAPEHALVLAKRLCGLPLDAPAGAPMTLSDDDRAEADRLLDAAIEYWTALGGASPDALRGTFLTRPGKLSRRDDGDLLQIEPQPFDILLERLPWGLSVVSLPWMDAPLWVEWPA